MLNKTVLHLIPLMVIVVVMVANSQIPDISLYQLISKTHTASYQFSWAMLGWEYISFHLMSKFSSTGDSTPS